jgi:glycyl-tRNA synthetase beta chain
MSDFLLEIGTEEIPHWMIPSALAQLAKFDVLGEAIVVDATPRRLVLRATNVPPRTPDVQQLIKGPPVSAGERAIAGFATKQQVDVGALERVGDHYQVRKLTQGRPAIDVLAERLPDAILGIQWPKTMYWTEKDGPRFIRPIRWIVALLGEDVIRVNIQSIRGVTYRPVVRAGDVTRGHRQLGSSSIPVTITNYESELRKNFVILSSSERRKKIETEAAALGAKPDADLLETLTFVTEYPTAIRGDFDPSFLTLPSEVLTTVLKHHQKTFSIESAPGILAPHFVAIMNTSADPDGWVKLGNERVIKARFNDARFFWNVDQQKTLEARVEDLAKVTFHAKLGSYLEKTNRVIAIVKELNGGPNAERAARLCKTDLTTEMVKEFTDLQGIIGGLYAEAQGENPKVSDAIYEHYRPLSMDSPLPKTADGLILALADKLDTLRECFKIGMMPTGSKDPFALRRAAQGVVRILANPGMVHWQIDGLVQGDLLAFVRDRAKYYFQERGYKYDEVNAVLASGHNTILGLEDRLHAVAETRSTEYFEPLVAGFKRVRNLLDPKFRPTGEVVISLIESGPEREIFDQIEKIRNFPDELSSATKLVVLAGLQPAIDNYCDNVMVNVDDPKLRANRLTFLYELLKEFSTIADFSEIVTAGEK